MLIIINSRGKYMKDEQTHSKTQLSCSYVSSLDGLRAIGVILVILYHLNLPFAKGGLIGVTLFFVLSGYLITSLLIDELHTTHHIRLGRFWFRRIRRLFPPMLVVVVCTGAACALCNQTLFVKLKADILPALSWTQNWWYIFHQKSYFEAVGNPSPLLHFWSLAIEEQFYLLWPLILFCCYKTHASKKAMKRICLILSACSVVAMLVLYRPDQDPTRIYYGLDTRAFSLFIGAWLAFVCPWKHKTDKQKTHDKLFGAADGIFFLSLAGILLISVYVSGTSEIMFRGMLIVVSALSAAMIAAAILPNTLCAKLLSLKPLSWIGKRSYGIYLWHWPLILLLQPFGLQENASYSPLFIVSIFIGSFLLAALSYRFVETPIRKGLLFTNLRQTWHDLVNKHISPKTLSIAIPLLITCIASGITIFGVCTISENANDLHGELVSTGQSADQAQVAQEQQNEQTKTTPLIIGDSVPAAINYSLIWPHALNDSYIGRWTYQAADVINDYTAQANIGNCIIVACFSNHPLKDGDLDKLLEATGQQRQLFLVNVRTPDPSVLANNQKLAEFAQAHENVHLVDWYQASANHKEYFWNDGIHLHPKGMRAYLALLQQNVNPYLSDEDKTNVNPLEINDPVDPQAAEKYNKKNN